MLSSKDLELFKLLLLVDEGNIDAKWKIIWKFDYLIRKKAKINKNYSAECQEYIEKAIFNSFENFRTLKKIKKMKKI